MWHFGNRSHLKTNRVDVIIGRNIIKKYHLFEKILSRLGVKLQIPAVDPTLRCTKITCDCLTEPPLTSPSKTLTISQPRSLVGSLTVTVESQNLLGILIVRGYLSVSIIPIHMDITMWMGKTKNSHPVKFCQFNQPFFQQHTLLIKNVFSENVMAKNNYQYIQKIYE